MLNNQKNIFLVLLLVVLSVVLTAFITTQLLDCTKSSTNQKQSNKTKSQSSSQGISLEEASRSFPAYPSKYTVERINKNEVRVLINPEEGGVGFHIYRHCTYLDETPTDLKDFEWTLVGMLCRNGGNREYIDQNAKLEKCLYALTAINSWGNESSKGSPRVVERVNQ